MSSTLIDLLDDYGWANTDEERKKALLSWMKKVTNEIQRNQQMIENMPQKISDSLYLEVVEE